MTRPGPAITLASQRRAYAWRLAVMVVVVAVVLWRGAASGEEPQGRPGKVHTQRAAIDCREIVLGKDWVSFNFAGKWTTIPRESVHYIEWTNVDGRAVVPRYTVPGMQP